METTLGNTKYRLTIETKDIVFKVLVLDSSDYSLLIIEGLNINTLWKSKLVVPESEEVFVISCDSTGLRLTGFTDSKEVYSVICNDNGELTYRTPCSFKGWENKEEPSNVAVDRRSMSKHNNTHVKLPVLNAMIALINDKDDVGDMVYDLKVNRNIVTTVMCAYNSIKPIGVSAENQSVSVSNLISYIVKHRIVNNVKTLIEQNHTVDQIATLANVTLDEADWLVWFVEINKANMKSRVL